MKKFFIFGFFVFLFVNFTQADSNLDTFENGINAQWKYWDGPGDFDFTPLANSGQNAVIQTPGVNGTNQALKLNLTGAKNRSNFYWIDNDLLHDEFDPVNTPNGSSYISESNGAKYLNFYINYSSSILTTTNFYPMSINLYLGKKSEHGTAIEVKSSGTGFPTVIAKNISDPDYHKDSPHYRRQTTYACALGPAGNTHITYTLPDVDQWKLVSIPLTDNIAFKMVDRFLLVGEPPKLPNVANFSISNLGQQIDDPLKPGNKFTLLVTEICIGFAPDIIGTVSFDEIGFSATPVNAIENKSWGTIKEMFK